MVLYFDMLEAAILNYAKYRHPMAPILVNFFSSFDLAQLHKTIKTTTTKKGCIYRNVIALIIVGAVLILEAAI